MNELYEMAAKYCDRCGSKYNENDGKIVREHDNYVLLVLKCHNCGASHMVSIAVDKGIGSRFSMNSDLEPEELRLIKIGKGISSDELLDVHSLITKSIKNLKDISNYSIPFDKRISIPPEKNPLPKVPV